MAKEQITVKITNPPTPPQHHPSPLPRFFFLLLYPHFEYTCSHYACRRYFTHIFVYTRSLLLFVTLNVTFCCRSCWGTGQGPRNKDVTHRVEKGETWKIKRRRQGTKYVGCKQDWGRGMLGWGGRVKVNDTEYHILVK